MYEMIVVQKTLDTRELLYCVEKRIDNSATHIREGVE